MNVKLTHIKTVLRVACTSLLFLCCLLQWIGLCYMRQIADKVAEHEAKSQSVYNVNAPMIANNAIYRLYECGGKIGIYDAKTEVLVDIIDVFVATLPSADRLALKKGIEIFAFSELAQIIEDFST